MALLAPAASGQTAGEERRGSELRAAGCDTLVRVRPGDTLFSIAGRLLRLSRHHSRPQLVEEIRRANSLPSDTLMPGQKLRVSLSQGEMLDFTVPKPRTFSARGVYVNASATGTHRIMALADRLVEVGGNTIVFDIKDQPGDLSYVSQVPLAVAIGASDRAAVHHPAKLIDALHRRGLHVVARIACFYDRRLARARPDLMPWSRQEQEPWKEKGAFGWVDPAQTAAQDYLLALVAEVAGMGIDEIQLDYIRFPTEGDVEDAIFAFDQELVPKHEIITGFLGRVREVLEPTEVLLSADIFGVAAWGREADLERTGQSLPDMLPLLDVVSPMLYPSHFYGTFDQVPNPAAHPYYFVYQGCRHLRRLAEKHGVVVRPWIQSFPYRVPEFDEDYVIEQLRGAEEGGARGWLLWNPASRYEVGLAAIDRFMNAPAAPDSVQWEQGFPPAPASDKDHPDPLGACLEDGSLDRGRRAAAATD